MCWLDHVVRRDDGWRPKDLLYEESVQEIRPTGRPQLYYNDFWNLRNLKAMSIGPFQAPRETRRSWQEEWKRGVNEACSREERKRGGTLSLLHFPLVFVPLAYSFASLVEPDAGYLSIDLNTWEALVQKGLSKFEETLAQ